MSSESMQTVLPARQSFERLSPLFLPPSLHVRPTHHHHHLHHRGYHHSSLPSGHCRGRNQRAHHGIGIQPGTKTGENKPLSSFFLPFFFFFLVFFRFSDASLASPPPPPHHHHHHLLSRCLSTVSEGIEGKENHEDYYFFLALSRGVFRPLGAGGGGFPQLGADR